MKHMGCVGTARGLTEAWAKYRGAALGAGRGADGERERRKGGGRGGERGRDDAVVVGERKRFTW